MEAKFSNRVKEVISLSREEALRLGHDYIGTEHLLLGVIREGEGLAISLLKKLGISLDDLRASVEHNTKNTSVGNLKNLKNIPLTRQSEKVLKITYLEAKIFKSKIIGTEHLLLSILRDEDNIATQILDKFDEVILFAKKLESLIVITRGEKGSIAIQKNEVVECDSQKNLKIVDLTGAGDLFAAGFLHGHVNNLSIKESLQKGTEMSSKIIQKIGARLN